MAQTTNLGFGCVSLTSHAFLRDAQNILSLAFSEGIRHFDTAPLYGNGYSEKILGTFIKNKRSQVTITTKCGLGNPDQPAINLNIALVLNALKNRFKKKVKNDHIQQPALLKPRLIDIDYVKRSLQQSLKNLQTGHIDYYLLHEALPAFLSASALSFLIKQKQKGIIGKLGIAAGYINLLSLENIDPGDFTVLQYENGPNYNTDHLLTKFSGNEHFYHSILRSVKKPNKEFSNSEWAGILLNRACKINSSGKVLFSTTKKENLKKDIAAFEKYNDLSLNELNKLINAVY